MSDMLESLPAADLYIAGGQTGAVPLIPGIVDRSDVQAALKDTKTVSETDFGVPLATPLKYNSWYKPDYFERHGISKELVYFAGHEALASYLGIEYEGIVNQAITSIADRDQALVFEYSEEELGRLEKILERLGAPYTLGLTPTFEDTEPRPIDYVIAASYKHFQPAALDSTIQDVFEYSSNDPRLAVVSELTEGQIEESYEHYMAAFSEVQSSNPMDATFGEEDYRTMMTSRDYIKFVCEDSKGLANIFVVNSVKLCNWIDQEFVRQRFPVAYDADKVLFCPGIFSRPDAPPALSLSTFGLAANAFVRAEIEPVLLTECNDVSVNYIPKLITIATQRTRLSHIAVHQPLQTQAVEVLMID